PFRGQILLDLYVAQKDYHNASLQAKYLYEENHNPYFLALEQVYAFESLNNKQNLAKVRSIVKNLKNAITLMQTPDKNTPKSERLNTSLQNLQSGEM
ncbi:MAG: ATP-dependent nuclease, partial [Helicobacter japonicus]|nr:ATP-dependent nuclease [Helicobacter japonicus]